jgi:anti-anti-sigma factor
MMMNISKTMINGYTKIVIEAERLDVANMADMKTGILENIDDSNPRVVIDLSGVVFLDSSGMSVLIGVFKYLNTINGELKLCGLQEQPNELMQITQLYNVFTVVDNCEQAVQ